MITVSTKLESANPSDPDHVERLDQTTFRIRPHSEDGDANYKFSLLVRVANRSTQPVQAQFVIDWDDPVHMSCRDYVLLGRRDRWRYFPAQIEGPVARASVVVPPGRHDLALHPTYSLDRLQPWRRRAERTAALSVRELGRTRQNRPILAFELGDEQAPPADRLAIVARFHPYETAGSFVAEGALRQLLKPPTRQARKYRVSAILIANPDGVADGLCKRSAPGGPDLAHQTQSSDNPAAAVLRRWLDGFQPALLLDFHGWMYRYQDGLSFNDPPLTSQIQRQLEASPHIDRAWKTSDLSTRPDPDSLWSYARTRHGTRSLIFSFGWYGRNVPQMRRIGAAVVSVLLASDPAVPGRQN